MIANWLFYSAQTQLYFILYASFALAVLQNVTVDDAVTAGPVIPGYLPSPDNWAQGSQCAGCLAKPDPSLAFNGTWHDSTFNPASSVDQTIQFTFEGSGLYIYFILANNLGVNVTTATNLAFILDGVQTGTFFHTPSSSADYQYNQSVYANNSIPYGQHTMTIAAINDTVNGVLFLFDYLIYTTNGSTTTSTQTSGPATSSSSPSFASSPSVSPSSTSSGLSSTQTNVGAIVGGTVGGVAALALIATCAIFYRRHKRRSEDQSAAFNPSLTVEPFVLPSHMAQTPTQGTPSSIIGQPLIATEREPRRKQTPRSWENAQSSNLPSMPTQSSSSVTPNRSNPQVLEQQVGMLREEVARLRRLQNQRDDPELGSEAPPDYFSQSG